MRSRLAAASTSAIASPARTRPISLLSSCPKNPLLLVAVADVQAREHQNDSAISSACDALDYLDRFTRPIAIAEHDWPEIKRNQHHRPLRRRPRAHPESVQKPAGTARSALLDQAASSLSQARAINPADAEIAYLLGEDYLFANDLAHAAAEFAFVYGQRGQFAPHAKEQLLYNAGRPSSTSSFEKFVNDAAKHDTISPSPAVPSAASTLCITTMPGPPPAKPVTAASIASGTRAACRRCCSPNQPQKVMGDFERNNEFYADDYIVCRREKLEVTPAPDRALSCATGAIYSRSNNLMAAGISYPVDYIIGSKWQQAYAATLRIMDALLFRARSTTSQCGDDRALRPGREP